MKRLALALCLLLPLPLTVGVVGCAHSVNAPAPTPIQKSAVILDDITVIVQSAQQAETAAYNSGYVDAATHKSFSQAFVNIANKEIILGNALQGSASAATVKDAVNALIDAVKSGISSGALNVKNPTTQAQLTALITTVQALSNNLLVAYGV